jgi:hypothetical protein
MGILGKSPSKSNPIYHMFNDDGTMEDIREDQMEAGLLEWEGKHDYPYFWDEFGKVCGDPRELG